MPKLENFALVGGTNLALRFGHRLSVDLDLFTNQPFDSNKIESFLEESFSNCEITGKNENMLFSYINDVKVDMILLPYPYLQPVEEVDGIRLVSVPDIIAMKLHAISNRGVKKDFWDIAELLNHYSLSEMMQFFKDKFSKQDIWHVLRSLVYFEDAEKQVQDPYSFKKVTWKEIKKQMQSTVKQYVNEQMTS